MRIRIGIHQADAIPDVGNRFFAIGEEGAGTTGSMAEVVGGEIVNRARYVRFPQCAGALKVLGKLHVRHPLHLDGRHLLRRPAGKLVRRTPIPVHTAAENEQQTRTQGPHSHPCAR